MNLFCKMLYTTHFHSHFTKVGTSQVLLSCVNKIFAGKKMALGSIATVFHIAAISAEDAELLPRSAHYFVITTCTTSLPYARIFFSEKSLLTCVKLSCPRRYLWVCFQAIADTRSMCANIQGRILQPMGNKNGSQSSLYSCKVCIMISTLQNSNFSLQRKTNLSQQPEQAKLPSLFPCKPCKCYSSWEFGNTGWTICT